MKARISRRGGAGLGLVVAVVVFAGCKKKPEEVAPEAPPETGHQTTEDRQKADLQAFFDGMLVPAQGKKWQEDPLWPLRPEDKFSDWILQTSARAGVTTREQLWAVMKVPVDQLTPDQAQVLFWIHDAPTLDAYWSKALAADPNDLDAVAMLEEVRAIENDLAGGLAAVTPRPDAALKWRGGSIEGGRCSLLLAAGRAKEAKPVCEYAMTQGPHFGHRTYAKVLVALGENKAAVAKAEELTRNRPNNPTSWLMLGIAQQANGDDAAAKQTWSIAHARWPDYRLFDRALAGPKRTMLEWEAEENAVTTLPGAARKLASCGFFYAEAGLEERSKACFRASERVMPGPALANQLVFEGTKTITPELIERTKAAAAATPHPDLFAALAWMNVHTKNFQEARTWAEKALEVEPDNEKALSQLWQACGGLNDFLCVIEARQKIGIPTHFNQAQYRDAKKAFDEQRRAEKTGLAVIETVSVEKLAAFPSVTVVPLGRGAPPELGDLAPMMAKALPGLRIEVGTPQPLPAMDETKLWSVDGEELLKALPAEPGKIYVVEQDLRVGDGFAFALHDPERGVALISLSRFRSYGGAPMEPGTALEGGALVAAQERVRGQLLASIATLLGLKPACSVDTCALRNRRTVAAFDLAPLKLCPEHQKQLEQSLAKLAAPH